MVGLSILSLNQFAENVSKAEALSAEIAIILKGLQKVRVSEAGADSPSSNADATLENTGMTRF